jgi:hypothetical protein
MNTDNLIRSIELFKTLGVQMHTASDEIGWYLLFKRKLIHNFFEKFASIADEDILVNQINVRDYPYVVIERKVSKEFCLNNIEIYSEADYKIDNVLIYAKIEDALEFIYSKGYSSEDFVWPVDLIYVE